MEAIGAGSGLDLWIHWLLLCDQGKVLAFSELALPYLLMGIIIGPPLDVKGGFNDSINFKWLAQDKPVNTSALVN